MKEETSIYMDAFKEHEYTQPDNVGVEGITGGKRGFLC